MEDADAILVIGGDGSLLHAIAEYQELDKPFIGVHGGTRGYLMNNVETPEQFINCIDFLDNREWELALDSLIELADETGHYFSDYGG